MQDAAMRGRLAALVLATLLAISGAALATALLAADDQDAGFLAGGRGNDIIRSEGSS
jgi:hypothetical protein